MEAAGRPTPLFPLLALFREIPEPDREPGPQRRRGGGGFFGAIGLLLAAVLVGRWVGPIVMSALLLVATGLFLWLRRR